MGTNKDSEKTRAKMIAAAGELFAEKGFKAVTVREIASKAKTHLSALNYHFRSKEALYHEVLIEACKDESLLDEEKAFFLKQEPNKAIFILVKEVLKKYRKQPESNWKVILINRECRESSKTFDKVLKERLEEDTDFIADLIGKNVGKKSDDCFVRFAVISLLFHLEGFGMYNKMIDAMVPNFERNFGGLDAVAKHIVHLTLEAASPSI